MLTTIIATPEQIEKIYQKHLKPFVYSSRFSYNDDDEIGFVSCISVHHAKIGFQFRDKIPCFFGLTIGNIRYDINYPEGKVLDRLTELGLKAEKDFWEGGQI